VTKSVILAIFGALIVASAIILNFATEDRDQELAPQETVEEKNTEKPLIKITPPIKSNLAKPELVEPVFSIVRITPQGDTVMAGRAGPGVKVEIYDGKNKIGEVMADSRGEWVFVPSTPLAAGTRELSLKVQSPEGIMAESKSNVILVVPEKGKDIGGRSTKRPTKPLAIKLPNKTNKRVEVLQKPSADHDVPISIESVDYDNKGKLNISGKAKQKSRINLYLNNKLLDTCESNNLGIWHQTSERIVKPGSYTIRADQVDTNGKVTSRIEVVFTHSIEPKGLQPGQSIVVQPGRSLWRIARKMYGSGIRYTIIYKANKNQIKDPDLIYPGQVFTLPKLD